MSAFANYNGTTTVQVDEVTVSDVVRTLAQQDEWSRDSAPMPLAVRVAAAFWRLRTAGANLLLACSCTVYDYARCCAEPPRGINDIDPLNSMAQSHSTVTTQFTWFHVEPYTHHPNFRGAAASLQASEMRSSDDSRHHSLISHNSNNDRFPVSHSTGLMKLTDGRRRVTRRSARVENNLPNRTSPTPAVLRADGVEAQRLLQRCEGGTRHRSRVTPRWRRRESEK